MRNLHRHIWAILILFFLLGLSTQAQYAPRIGSARPGFTPGAGTVGKKVFQSQNGYVLHYTRLEDALITNRIVDGTAIYDSTYGILQNQSANTFRYGLFERFELRYRLSYSQVNRLSVQEGGQFDQSSTPSWMDFGVRLNALHTEGVFGRDFAIQADMGFDFNPSIQEFEPALRGSVFLLYVQNLSGGFALTTNLGYEYAELRSNRIVTRASLRYNYTRWLSQVGISNDSELFGNSEELDFRRNADLAIGYFVSDNFSVDLGVQYAYAKDNRFVRDDATRIAQHTFVFTAGISWRLNSREWDTYE